MKANHKNRSNARGPVKRVTEKRRTPGHTKARRSNGASPSVTTAKTQAEPMIVNEVRRLSARSVNACFKNLFRNPSAIGIQ